MARSGKGDDLVKTLQKWSRKGSAVTGVDRTKMRDGVDGWVTGSELVKRWRQAFEEVGKGLEAEVGFDDDVKKAVEGCVDGCVAEYIYDVRDEDTRDEKLEMEVEGGVEHTTLNGVVRMWEVRRAIKRLQNGKAVGVDGVVGEVLKYGGEWMEESLWRLCAAVFVGEVVPVEWLRAIKVPVKKKGCGEVFEDYRGVTLLSVVGKVFGMVIEARLRSFCESRGILSDCQFGFRKERACRDPLVILTDIMERQERGRGCF